MPALAVSVMRHAKLARRFELRKPCADENTAEV